jgi:hypothetical protein
MDVDDGIQAIVVTREQHFRLGALEELFEFLEKIGEFVADRFALAGQFGQGFGVVNLTFDLTIEFDGFLEAGSLLLDLAGTLLIRPEIRLCDDLLNIIELPLLSGLVKGTSALPGCELLPERIGQ